MPSSPIGSKNNVKIFVLYLMRNINYPLDFVTINEIVMQTDYVMYLDFAEAFCEMLDSDLIVQDGENERGEPLYSVTKRGSIVAESLRCDILPSLLDKSMSCALRYLDFQRRGIAVDCTYESLADHTFDVTLLLREKDKTILRTTINVDSEYRCRKMRELFRSRPEVVYRGILALLSGNVDYLFDKP
ncbi:MAG: DUF4364 family protein [Clostridia bacterium]|nr:DUF4364 family protein [Clostridia bacterium]